MCAINNMDSCKSLLCDQEVRRIWSWAIEKDIPGIFNVEADQQLRKSKQELNGRYMNLSLAIGQTEKLK